MKTKLEFATALLLLVIALQEKGVRVRMDLAPDYILIMHFVDMGGIIGSIDKFSAFIYEGETDKYDEAINYLKSI